jgi:hypothetical protein
VAGWLNGKGRDDLREADTLRKKRGTIKRSFYGNRSQPDGDKGTGCLNKWSTESENCFLHREKAQAGFRKSE